MFFVEPDLRFLFQRMFKVDQLLEVTSIKEQKRLLKVGKIRTIKELLH